MNDRFEGAIIEVVAGQEQKTYHVHENLLRANSGFFNAALKKEWLEGSSRKVSLPEEDPKMVFRYITYLYTGSVASDASQTLREQHILLARSFVLGERLIDDKYKDKALDRMRHLASKVGSSKSGRGLPDMEAANIVYSGTPSTSPMRCFLVDLYMVHAGKSSKFTYEEDGEDVPAHHELMVDLVKAMSQKRRLRKLGHGPGQH